VSSTFTGLPTTGSSFTIAQWVVKRHDGDGVDVDDADDVGDDVDFNNNILVFW
jgi:hypothetical protein